MRNNYRAAITGRRVRKRSVEYPYLSTWNEHARAGDYANLCAGPCMLNCSRLERFYKDIYISQDIECCCCSSQSARARATTTPRHTQVADSTLPQLDGRSRKTTPASEREKRVSRGARAPQLSARRVLFTSVRCTSAGERPGERKSRAPPLRTHLQLPSRDLDHSGASASAAKIPTGGFWPETRRVESGFDGFRARMAMASLDSLGHAVGHPRIRNSSCALTPPQPPHARPGFTVVSNRCLANKAMLVLVDELSLL